MRFRTVVAALALILATFSGGHVRAQTTCNVGQFCVWADAGFSGTQVDLPINHHRPSNKLLHVMNNEVSSVQNNTAFAATLFDKKDARPSENRCYAPNASESDLSAFGFNDLASSSKVLKKTVCPL